MSKNVHEIIYRGLAGTVRREIDWYDPENALRLARIKRQQEEAMAEDALFDEQRDFEAESEIMHRANER